LGHKFAISSRPFKEEKAYSFKKITLMPVGVLTTGIGTVGGHVGIENVWASRAE